MRRFTRAEDLEGLEQIGRPPPLPFERQQEDGQQPPQLDRQHHQRWGSGGGLYTAALSPTPRYHTMRAPLSSSSSSTSLSSQQPFSFEYHDRHDHDSHFASSSSSSSNRDKPYHYEHQHPLDSENDSDSLDSDHMPSRHYIETHTTFLDSADPNSSGILPDLSPSPHDSHPYRHHHHYHQRRERANSSSAPGTPTSSGFLSSSSIGFYSQRSSRPSSRTGYWLDDQEADMMASSLNLVMPSSAMFFAKHREPTERGQHLGYVKLMVCGDAQDDQKRLLQLLLDDWQDVIACDLDDNRIQLEQQLPQASTSSSSSSLQQQQHPRHIHAYPTDLNMPPLPAPTTDNTATPSTALADEPALSIPPSLTLGDSPSTPRSSHIRASQSGLSDQLEGDSFMDGRMPSVDDGLHGFSGSTWTAGVDRGQEGQSGSGQHCAGSGKTTDVPSGLSNQEYTASVPSEEKARMHHDPRRPPSVAGLSLMYATVTERFASTATLPAWARAGFDEQEQGNEILVKNVCLVETPGGFKTSAIPQRLLDPILAYLGLQFQTTNEFFSRSALSNDAMGRFLINNVTGAHSHVDMCIYMIHGQLSPVDIQFMKQLSEFVNLVPVLIPAEATPPSQVMLDRLELMRQLCHHGIEIYGMDTDELLQDSRGVSSDSETSDRPMLPLGAFRASDPLTSIPMAPYLSPPFVFYLSSTLSSSSSSSFPENLTNPATTSHSWQDVAEDKSSPLGTSQYEQQATLPPSLAAAATAHPRSLQQPATADQSLLHLWNNQQMHVMRDWMLTTNLEALRYQTTLKFLAWRRQLPWMTLSDSLYSQQESSGHESMPSVADGDGVSGASSANGAPDSAYDHHHHHPLRPHRPGTHSHLLPSEHLAALQARNKERVTKAMLRILESESVVLRRILDERREAWRQALEQMEREERVEFLVQELKTWAREGGEQRYGDGVAHTAPAGSSGGGPVPEATTGGLRPVADFCRKTTNDAEGFVTRGGGSDTIVRSNLYQVSSDNPSDRGRFSGMGLEKGNHSTGSLRQQHQHQRSSVEICRAPTTVAGARTKQPLPSLSSGKPWFLSGSKVSSTPSTATTGSSRTRSRTRRSRARSRENESALWDSRPVLSLKASPRTSSVSSKPRDDGKDGEAEEDEDAENSRSDPLGLGSIVGRLFSALGRGVLNVAVVVTMTGLAQWVYSNFLEHMRVEWIL